MKKIETGDIVRFLNTVGGGQVKGVLSKQLAIVEDEHGFDVPVLISELVVVESAGNEKIGSEDEVAPEKTQGKPEIKLEKPDEEPEETPGGEEITACLAYLPTDAKSLTRSAYECYFVNDSNYYLFINYMSHENNAWTNRFNGLVEPNTKIFLEEFDKSQLNEIEKICVQFVAFKHAKPFKFKNSHSVELRIDTVKFYKLHSFQENDYFDESAMIYYLVRNDMPERDVLLSAGEIERAMKEKNEAEKRPRIQKIKPKETNPVIEVDLHINHLLETTAGMNNADMLEYQLQKFNEAMGENLRNKNQKLVFIHGKGDGVLKNAILKELKQKYKNCYVQDASFREYGFGATMVTIK
ncbi:MAG: DUF2027 domain-containing protein [Dysgonamonadaceae bacterium]|nr:DUF2027 domain-containing protein [Dysgonamonadaceae bacterium]